jgi:hypothetical protein
MPGGRVTQKLNKSMPKQLFALPRFDPYLDDCCDTVWKSFLQQQELLNFLNGLYSVPSRKAAPALDEAVG